MTTLKRSKDRKVANYVTASGGVSIANTFGLPSGKAYSCPGATSVCEVICYAGKLEKIYKGVRTNLLHNWSLLKDASEDEVWQMIDGEHPDGTNILDLDASEVNVHVDGSSFNVEEIGRA